MNKLTTGKTMTVKEVAAILGVDTSTIQKKVKALFPEIVTNGKTTLLTEPQVTLLKKSLFDMNPNLGRVSEVKTDLEKEMLIQQAMIFQAEKIQSMQSQLEIMKPKADFYDQVTDSTNAIDIGSVANVLNIDGLGRNKLFTFLRGENILKENNQPYREYIDRGYFRVIEQKYSKPDGSVHVSLKTVVYQTGVDYIRKIVLSSL